MIHNRAPAKHKHTNSDGPMKRKLILRKDLKDRFIKKCIRGIDDRMNYKWYKPYRNIGNPNIDSTNGQFVPIVTLEYHNKSIWKMRFGESEITFLADAEESGDVDVLSALEVELEYEEFKRAIAIDDLIEIDSVRKLMVDYIIEKHVPKFAKIMCKSLSHTIAPDIAELALSMNERFSSALLREIASQLSA